MSEFTDRVEDALIHFEDSGYKHHIQNNFKINDGLASGNNFYTLLKGFGSDMPISISRVNIITITKRLYTSPIVLFKEWSWINDELKTAIKRMVSSEEELGNVKVSGGGVSCIVEIKESEVYLHKVKSICEICRKFNSKNLGAHISIKYNAINGADIFVIKSGKMDRSEEIIDEIKKSFEVDEDFVPNGQIILKLRSDKIKIDDRIYNISDK